MSTALYNVLSGLHKSDTLLSTTITTLSGKLSPAFTANSFTVGSGSGLSASQYVLPVSDAKTSAQFGTAKTVATEKNVSTFVDGKIAGANSAAISGASFNAPITGEVTQNTGGKHLTVGVAVDNKTVKSVSNQLSAVYTLSAITTASGYASSYALVDGGNVKHGEINIPKDQFLKDAKFGYSTANDNTGAGFTTTKSDSAKYPVLQLTFDISKGANDGQTATSSTDTDKVVYVNLNGLVDVYTGESGITVNGYTISWTPTATSGVTANGGTITAQINASSNANDGFLKNSANGLYTEGIKTYVGNVTSAMVTAPSDFAAADQIILANAADKTVKSSGVKIATNTTGVTDSNEYVPTSKAVSSFVGTKLGSYVEGPSASVNLNIAQFDGTNGKKIKDSGKSFETNAISATNDAKVPTNTAIWKTVSGLVSGTVATVTANDFAMFDGTNGRALKDSTVSLQKSIDTNGTTLADETKIPTAKAISGYIATQTANYVTPSGSDFNNNEIALFADTTGKKIKTANASISTAAITSGSTDTQIPTAKAVHAAISGFIRYGGEVNDGADSFPYGHDLAIVDDTNKVLYNSTIYLNSTYGVAVDDISTKPTYHYDPDDKSVPTVGHMKNYIYDLFDSPSLTTLEGNINALNTAITNLNS